MLDHCPSERPYNSWTPPPPKNKLPFGGGGCVFFHKFFCSKYFRKMFYNFIDECCSEFLAGVAEISAPLLTHNLSLKNFLNQFWGCFSSKKGAILFLKCAWWVHIMLCQLIFREKVSSMSKNPNRKKKLSRKLLAIFSGKNESNFFSNVLLPSVSN